MSERREPPRDVDPIEELVRIVGEAHDDPRSRGDVSAPRTGERRIRSRRLGEAMNSGCAARGKNPPLLPIRFPIRFSGKQQAARC
jgi:hypothetical protein